MRSDKLNGNERVMLQQLASGKTPTEAAMTAYNATTKRSASTMASRVLKRKRFQQALEHAGLTSEKLAQKFAEGLEASKPVATRDGVIFPPDFIARLGYLKTALRALDLISDKEEPDSDGEPLIIRAVKFEQNNLVVNHS